MKSRDERIAERAQQIRQEEGASHGRDPENLDPVMLEGEDAEVVRANKAMAAISRGEARDDDPVELRPDKGELPPPD